MGTEIPKQFIPINGFPILMHTILKMRKCGVNKIILVLPTNHMDYWKSLCAKYSFESPAIVAGGKERFHSVQNGINALDSLEGIVGIHDAVRPFVSDELIHQGFEIAQKKGSAIPYAPIKDSIRKLEGENLVVADRNLYKAIQTPQFFDLKTYTTVINATNFNNNITDDTSVYELAGHTPTFYEAQGLNLKITTKEDLEIAKALL